MNLDTPIIACDFLKGFLEVTRTYGISFRELAMRAGLRSEDLDGPGKKLTARQYSALWETGFRISAREDLGLSLGNRLTLTSYGMAGVAVMAQPTVGEAMSAASRLCAAIFPIVNMEYVESASSVQLRLVPIVQTEEYPRYLIELIFVSFYNVLHYLIGKEYEPVVIRFAFPGPSYVKKYRRYFHCPLKFSQPVNEFELAKAVAEKSLPLANSVVSRIVEDQVVANVPHSNLFPKKVRSLLARQLGSFPTLEVAAKMLGVSGRTLRRQLLDAGTNFQTELDNVRKEFAENFLREQDKSITQVALLLGFNDSSAFSRAFKRWTGVTPSEYARTKVAEAEIS